MNRLEIGDTREVMKRLIAEGVKVQMCVTSPPYWALRDYGVAGQLGLEPTIEAYVQNMVEVFRLVRKLLTDDGTLWLNLGDTYSSIPGGFGRSHGKEGWHPSEAAITGRVVSLPAKNLCGIPWRVAFALQPDGWILRSEIIWSKLNPMPESATDRPTKAHEQVFLFSKKPRYFYDGDAVREAHLEPERSTGKAEGFNVKDVGSSLARQCLRAGGKPREYNPNGRNLRTVWTIPTESFPDSHFATFPKKLAETCIKAGSRPGDIVLDPFAGSGTVGEVAELLGRQWLLIELNPEYEKLIRKRTQQPNMFTNVKVSYDQHP